MAGVGFELRRMIEERRGMIAKVRAYSCAGLISSGPWLMTILTLTLLNLAGPYLGGTEGYSLFRALVTYAFAFSLILQGIAQMAVTRRVADLLYTKRYDAVLPAFVTTIVAVGLVHALIGTAFCVWADFPTLLSVTSVALFAIIGMTWIALIWLTVVRQYDEVLRAYVYGTLVAMVGVVLLFLGRGTVGILAAYTAGQAFTLALLLRTIARGMNASGGRDLSVLKSLVHFPLLVGVGLFYNAAIWVDKMIFWFQDGGGPHSLVRYHPLYDTCSFLAYLTVVPALAVNLVRLETAFYERYRGYYGAILGGTPLAVIEDKRRRMLRNLEESMVRLIKTQGAISALVILFAPVICDFLKLPPIAVRLFRLTCLGAFFHVLLLINILMQMYFDLRKQALATSLAFFVLNGALAWWSVNRGIETFGIGYAIASFLSLLFGYLLLYRSLDQLDYMTFTSQPIGSDEERREATVLAEQERAAEEAAAAAEAEEAEEDEEREVPAPAPIVVAAGEMAPPDPDDKVAVEEIVLEEEAVPADVSRLEGEEAPATATDAVGRAPEATVETATDLPSQPKVSVPPTPEPVAESEPSAVETATDLPSQPKVSVPPTPEPVAESGASAVETATDLPSQPKVSVPPTPEPVAESEASAVETAAELPQEPRVLVPPPAVDETATDLPAEPKLPAPPTDATETADAGVAREADADADATATEADASPETSTDVVDEPGSPRPADADATATEIDSAALEAVVDEAAEELEFVGFRRPPPAEEPETPWTEHWSLVDALDAATSEEDMEATATDVGELGAAVDDLADQVDADSLAEEVEEVVAPADADELAALMAAVDDLADQVDADPLRETCEEDPTATDVVGLTALKDAVGDLADQVDAGALDAETEEEQDEEAEEEQEETNSELDAVLRHFRKPSPVDPDADTAAD